MTALVTTLGLKSADALGVILPHEHIFVDLRTWDQPGYGEGNAEDVIALMGPEVKKAMDSGVTALVECSTTGVGRRADILKAFSEATGFPIVAPTGVYREPWIPQWIHEAEEDRLYEWMRDELENQIEDTGVQAGFIKLSAGDDGITPTEAKVLRAASRAGAATNAVIGSHTIRGRVVRDQLDIIEQAGYTANRFIWIHTQAEPDFDLHLEMARRGVWIEYDSIGEPKDDAMFIDWIRRMIDTGYADQIMLSHDRGWYDPAQPGGGVPRPFTYLTQNFLPKLEAAGVSPEMIRKLVQENPFRAFAR
jgi:phosphotriesterase-related protein